MATSKAELKILQRRTKRLRDYLDGVRNSVAQSSGSEAHVAVTMSTRILNMIVSTFDVGVVDTVHTYDINSRVVRLRREDKATILDLKQRIAALYEQMVAYLDTKLQGLARASV